ncbi:MAG: flagellar biosynthetic protein FliR [Alphaproteobacteria bacterium]
MLQDVLQADVFAFFLVFARMGAAVMLMPGLGESYVSARIRLMIALAIALVVTPVVSDTLPPQPDSPAALVLLMGGEVMVGLFLGMVARIVFNALQTAGMIIAYQTGMANAFIADPTAAVQGALFGVFLGVLGILIIFETGLHQLLLSAVIDSYHVFVPGHLPPLDDFSRVVARVVADSFDLSVRMAAPFLVVALVFYLGLGLLGRLMPQIQVFFIALPLQVVLGLVVLMLTIIAIMNWFAGAYENTISTALMGR